MSGTKSFRHIKIQCIHMGIFLRATDRRVSVFIKEINYLLSCLWRKTNAWALCRAHYAAMRQYLAVSTEPRARVLALQDEIACKQSSTGGAGCFKPPPIRGLRSNMEPELAVFIPPLRNILQTSQPNWKRSIMCIGK